MSELKFFEHSITKNPKYLVIFLHGYGSNGENLIGLAPEFARILPDAHYISPNAPLNWEGGFPDCYQWFSLANWGANRDAAKVADDIKKANQTLNNFILQQLKRFNLNFDNLFLVGFSQGAMMSMYHGLISSIKAAGIISYSGKLILPEILGEKTISKPEICLIHGKEDSVLPFTNFIEAEKLLTENQIPFQSHAINDLDHTIDIHGIRIGMNFLGNIVKNLPLKN